MRLILGVAGEEIKTGDTVCIHTDGLLYRTNVCWGEDKEAYRSVQECLEAGNKVIYMRPYDGCKDE